jgi:hypothetical protein
MVDRPVIFDEEGGLWAAARDGVVVSRDLSSDFRVRESLLSSQSSHLLPPPPFQRQRRPTLPPLLERRVLLPRKEVELNILRAELANEERARVHSQQCLVRTHHVISGMAAVIKHR